MRASALILSCAVGGMLTLSGCANSKLGGPGQGTISCTVVYREKMLIPADAVTIVELVDTTAPGSPVITWSTVSGHTGPPISFSFEFENSAITVQHAYALQARIENDGRVMFSSAERVPVLTQGHGKQAEVLVRRSP